MKTITAIITLISAIAISAVAAYMSVTGMMALFAATAVTVCVAMTILEISKLAAAQWLHSNWSNPNVNILHKTYKLAAVGALMLITSIGIYGFLSKGHLEQAAPIAGIELQVKQRELEITTLTASNTALQTKLTQLDKSIDSFLSKDKASQGLRARNNQKAERATIDTEIKNNNKEIARLNAEILPLKIQTSEVEAKLGPIKYVAELFGWTDENSAVRMVIMILMFAFDPLAVVMLLSAMISFKEISEERKAKLHPVIEQTMPPEATVAPKEEIDTQVTPEEKNLVEDQPTVLNIVHDDEYNEQMEIANAIEDLKEENTEVIEPVAIDPVVEAANRKYRKALNKFVQDSYIKRQPKPTFDIVEESKIELFVPSKTNTKEKKQLIELLEKQPGLLDEMIDVISTYETDVDAAVPSNDETVVESIIIDDSNVGIEPVEQKGAARNSWLPPKN